MRRWIPQQREKLVPWFAAAFLFVLLYTLAMLRHHTLMGSYDLGYFRQAAWLISHGETPFVTLRGLHLIGDHANFGMFPIALLTRLGSEIPILLAVQSAALAVGVVPAWFLCRKVAEVPLGASMVVIAAYGLAPAVHNVNLFDFHPEVVAVPALLGTVLFAFSRSWIPFGICMALVLLAKEDLGVVVIFLGVLLLIEKMRWPGLITIAAGAAWLFLDVFVFIPHYSGGYAHTFFFQQYGDSFREIVGTMLTSPMRVLRDLLTEQHVLLAMGLLGPVLLLPLLAPKYLIPGVPLQLLFMISSRPDAHTLNAQYTVPFLPFVFVATAMALGRRGPVKPTRGVLVALIAASLVLNTALSNGGLLKKPWEWTNRDAIDRARLAGEQIIPDDAPISASVRLWPIIADRKDLYNFPSPFIGYEPKGDQISRSRRQRLTCYIFVDTADGIQWNADLDEVLEPVISEWGFTEIFNRDGILVFSRC